MLRGKAGHGDVQAAMLAAMEERHVAGLIEVYANNFALRPTAAVGKFEGTCCTSKRCTTGQRTHPPAKPGDLW
jgi:hypothetical protein